MFFFQKMERSLVSLLILDVGFSCFSYSPNCVPCFIVCPLLCLSWMFTIYMKVDVVYLSSFVTEYIERKSSITNKCILRTEISELWTTEMWRDEFSYKIDTIFEISVHFYPNENKVTILIHKTFFIYLLINWNSWSELPIEEAAF